VCIKKRRRGKEKERPPGEREGAALRGKKTKKEVRGGGGVRERERASERERKRESHIIYREMPYTRKVPIIARSVSSA